MLNLTVHQFRQSLAGTGKSLEEIDVLAKEHAIKRVASKPSTGSSKPCATKVCRLGERECKEYWSCRDTCKVESKRLTEMEDCPNGILVENENRLEI